MQKITLELADNGIIKTIHDDNIDGAGKTLEKKTLYTMDDSISNTESFLKEMITDLGLFTGNVYEKEVLHIGRTYGNKYILNDKEFKEESKQLSSKLNTLKKTKSLAEPDGN